MLKKSIQRRLFRALAGTVGPSLIRLLASSMRYQVTGRQYLERFEESGEPFLLTFWHGQMLPVLFFFLRDDFDQGRFHTIISPHRDGEYVATLARELGIHSVRTSRRDRSLRALINALKVVRKGGCLAITPDGPLGPAFQAHEGTILLAEKAERLILPVAALPSRGHFFGSWDHFSLPYPLGKIRVIIGEPMDVTEEVSSTREAQNELTKRLNELTRNSLESLPAVHDYTEWLASGSATEE